MKLLRNALKSEEKSKTLEDICLIFVVNCGLDAFLGELLLRIDGFRKVEDVAQVFGVLRIGGGAAEIGLRDRRKRPSGLFRVFCIFRSF